MRSAQPRHVSVGVPLGIAAWYDREDREGEQPAEAGNTPTPTRSPRSTERTDPMARFLAHTPHDGITTEHETLREAQYAARKRQGYEHGRVPGQCWQKTLWSVRLDVWEDCDTCDRGLNALVWKDSPIAPEAIRNAYGIEI